MPLAPEIKPAIGYFQQLFTALNHPLLANVTAGLNAVDVNKSDREILDGLKYVLGRPVRNVLRGVAETQPISAVQVGVETR